MSAPSRRPTPPQALRERRAGRLLTAIFVCGLYAVLDRVYLAPVLEGWGIRGLLRVVVGAAIVCTWLLPLAVVLTSTYSSDYSLARLRRPARIAAACAATGAAAIIFVAETGHRLPLVGSTLGAALVAGAIYVPVLVHARRSQLVHRHRLVRLENVDDADELIGRCREELLGTALTQDERAAVELNLAGALVTLSRRGDRDDGLPEAYGILEQALRSSPPAWAFLAAGQLVEAMDIKAERSGDLEGHAAALDLLVDAAAAASAVLPQAPSAALARRARSLVQLSERAGVDGDLERSQHLRERAVAGLRQALDLSPERSRLHAEHTIALARIAGPHPLHDDLDAAITNCRRALRVLWLDSWRMRAEGYLALADLLALRAVLRPGDGIGGKLESLWPDRPKRGPVGALWPDRSGNDAARALWLCYQLSFVSELGPAARERIPRLTQLLREGELSYLAAGTRSLNWMYRQSFAEQARLSPTAAAALANRWAAWAAASGDVRQSAEAHWSWITSVVADSRRRVVMQDKERRLSRVQGLAANTCASLIAAGRPADAAVALELGRAVLLTERMSRERPGLDQRLIAAGREDLADRWRQARDRLAQAERTGFEDGPAAAGQQTTQLGGRAFPSGFASAQYLALADHERLLRKISAVPGCEDVDASLDYDDLRSAACEGPLVYLSATDEGGSAVIVTQAAEPVVVMLGDLRADEVRARAERLLALRRGHDIADEMAAQAPWLWESLMQPLAQRLASRSVVTLVPVGALGLLPLHIAAVAPDRAGIWHDRLDGVVFRVVPNARVLLRAQRAARARVRADEQARMLTVAVPDAPGYAHLAFAACESSSIQARFGEARTERPEPASVAGVLAALDRCAIWHFACHCVHDLDDPLDSRLLLDDGADLTLRAIFRRPAAECSLAVLSACQSAVPHRTLLDEVLSFPAALLQAGVAGVVSTQAAVGDRSAMLLVLRFFDRLRAGVAPVRALAEAQSWLRSATNGRIHGALPDAYPLPCDRTEAELAYWSQSIPFAEPSAWATFSYAGA